MTSHISSCILSRFRGFQPKAATVMYLLLACASTGMARIEWRPVPQEEFNMTAPSVETDGGAEILLREIKVDDSDRNWGSELNFYFRLKAFNEAGVQKVSPFVFDSMANMVVDQLEARVFMPDGSCHEIDTSNARSRITYKYGDEKTRTTSLPISGVVPGCIVEVKWCETLSWYRASDLFFGMAQDIPVMHSVFRYRPTNQFIFFFNTFKLSQEIQKGKSGFWETEMTNLPGIPDDNYLPSRWGVQPWLVARYTKKKAEVSQDHYWKMRASEAKSENSKNVMTSKAIKEKAAELTQGVTDPVEKLRRLYNFCAHDIVNIYSDNSGYSWADIEKIDKDETADDVLKKGRGPDNKIKYLFASLAKASGFTTDFAYCNDRLWMDWNIGLINQRMNSDLLVCIRNGDHWDFYEPGRDYLPFGMLRKGNEKAVAIVGNHKEAEFVVTPYSGSGESQITRKGDFALADDGTLSGQVAMHFTGHCSRSIKMSFSGKSTDEKLDYLKEQVHDRLPSAEITDIQFENIEDQTGDVDINYTISVSGYADSTGTRIFLQPAVFEKGMKKVFPKDTRDWDIRFPYTWEEHDQLRISFPESFEVEEGNAPQSIMDTEQLAYTVQLGLSNKKHMLVYKRDKKINILDLPVAHYDSIKQIFDAMYTQDNHVLSLKNVSEEDEDNEEEDSDGQPLASLAQ